MIKAKRVLDAIRFLELGERWSVMARDKLRLTVYGVENDIVYLEMHTTDKDWSIRLAMSLTELETRKNTTDTLAFEMVEMASKLGVYNDQSI